jgi:hypothetical protein
VSRDPAIGFDGFGVEAASRDGLNGHEIADPECADLVRWEEYALSSGIW